MGSRQATCHPDKINHGFGLCSACYERDRRKKLHPDRLKNAARRHRYGINPDQYDALIEEQSGLCAICGSKMDRPYIDHNHETKVVRGLLCPPCNTLLGMAKDDPVILARAIIYLLERG